MMSEKPMIQSSKELHDPIADTLDGWSFQSHFSSTRNNFRRCYDMDMIGQSALLSGSEEVSTKKSLDKMQICSKLFEDMENTCAVPSYEVGSIGSAYSEIGRVYLDPVAIYIEKLFITKPSYLFSIYVVVQVYQAPCNEDQDGNTYQIP